MHKGYTLVSYIRTIKALKEKKITTNFYQALAPRGGFYSDKAATLDEFLGDEDGKVTRELIKGVSTRTKKLGKTAKTRLLNALKNRKTKGKVF